MSNVLPEYIDDDEFNYADALQRPTRAAETTSVDVERIGERRRLYAAGVDLYLVLVTGVLFAQMSRAVGSLA